MPIHQSFERKVNHNNLKSEEVAEFNLKVIKKKSEREWKQANNSNLKLLLCRILKLHHVLEPWYNKILNFLIYEIHESKTSSLKQFTL